jgi:hypothetical protein
MSQPYLYESLPKASTVRILQLLPGEPSSELRGQLLRTKLDDAPPYEALSYVWGADPKDHQLKLESGSVNITPSLHSALQRLRLTSMPRNLWADAVCINQEDNSEKSYQVQLMSRIYEKAEQSIIFLGTTSDDQATASSSAFELIRAITKAELGEATGRYIEESEYRDAGLPPPRSIEWKHLDMLLELPWFIRLWVIQECAVARKALLVWGENEMEFKDFFDAVAKKNTYGIGPIGQHQSALATRATIRMFFMAMLSDAWPKTKYPLARLLNQIDHAKATLPQDNMFALLGLSQESDARELAPNYDETLEESLLRYALYFLCEKKAVDILSSSGLSQRSYPSSVPTWVPLWTSSMRQSRVGRWQPDGNTFFHATGSAKADVTVTSDSEILEVSGFIVDVLTVVHNSRWSDEYHGDTQDTDKYMHDTFLDADDTILNICESSKSQDDQKLFESQWRNLLFDMVWGHGCNSQPTQEWETSYLAFRKYLDHLSRNDWDDRDLAEEIMHARKEGEVFYSDFWVTRYLGVCSTTEKRLGRIPPGSRPGDLIAMFLGAAVPFVLRKCESHAGEYQLVGECYLHGMMQGEVLDMPEFSLQTIRLR